MCQNACNQCRGNRMFPLARINEIQAAPERFQLLERLPLLDVPVPYVFFGGVKAERDGDTLTIAIVDVETTGLNAQTDEIIEFGFVSALYSVSQQRFLSMTDKQSWLRQPSSPIPAFITELTGITNEDVEGCSIDPDAIRKVCDCDIIIAHNARFDRAFIERFIGGEYRGHPIWACSIKDVNWKAMGMESNALSYLLFQCGYFFNGHRASDDCVATLAVLMRQPEAMVRIVNATKQSRATLTVVRSRFEVKDRLEALGCQWEPDLRHWYCVIEGTGEEIQAKIDAIVACDVEGAIDVHVTPLSLDSRYL